jgi:hypothetical protein
MIDPTGIGAADVKHSAAFYDGALGALGLRRACGTEFGGHSKAADRK